MKRGKFGNVRWDVITFMAVLIVSLLFFSLDLDVKITGYDTFTITAVPDAPTLLLPDNDSIFLFNVNNGFNWSGSDPEGNAMNYLFQVGNSTGFENGNLSVNVTLSDANVTLVSNNLSIGKYYWRARANDSEGNSDFSATREFHVAYAILNMSVPNNNSVVTTGSETTIQINEVENGALITGVDVVIAVNNTNTTYTTTNTSDNDDAVTNYTFTYTVDDVNSTYIDVVAVGYNQSNNVNVTSYHKLRITRAFSEASNPNATLLCGFPTTLGVNSTMNITLNFSTGVLVDTVNLTVEFPNGSLLGLTEETNNFDNYVNTSFGYLYNYTFNTSVTGDFNLRAEIRDINYPTSGQINRTQAFTVSDLITANLTTVGADNLELRDLCSDGVVYSGGNITEDIPSGVYDIKFINSNERINTFLYESNISLSVQNTTVCNFTDISETISVPSTTRAVDQFILACNSSLSFSAVNLTYNYTGITASVTEEKDLEFYKCDSVSSCTWSEFVDGDLNQSSNIFRVNFTNFSVFMLSEQVTPTSGGTVGGGGGTTSKSGGVKIVSIELINPENVEFLENETIRIPITLRNTGDFVLSNVFLDASIDNEFFDLDFDRSTVARLGKGEEYSTYLNVINKGAEPDQYEILVSATVFSPSFKDTTKIFLDLKDKEFSKKESLLDQIEFMNELFSGNPECLEFSEIIGEAKVLIDGGEYDKAGRLIENTISGCRELIALNEAGLNFPFRSVRAKSNLGLFVIESVAFLSITAILYYFYRKRKHS